MLENGKVKILHYKKTVAFTDFIYYASLDKLYQKESVCNIN